MSICHCATWKKRCSATCHYWMSKVSM